VSDAAAKSAVGPAAIAREREPEDLVLGEEAGERRIPAMAAVATANVTNVTGMRRASPAHLADVLLAAEGVDDAARAQEQARLEECVRIQMKDGDPVGPDADRDEHEAELRDRGIRRAPS
jgi:hypothetical protein